MARGRGGPRTPADPAPVSGPGALSQRTDGGPSQPIRLAPGGAYGERKALESQQRSAPLAAGGTLQAPGPSPSSPGPGAPPDVFGPSQRPTELPNAGNGLSQGRIFQQDPDALLKALYQLYPHPDIARLIDPNNAP